MRYILLLLLWALPLVGDIYPNRAPEFSDISSWINSPPLKMSELRGKVVLIDFWSYSCINCLRTIPYLNHWYEVYKDKGLVIIGVHSPEFAFEHLRDNVLHAVKRYRILYPVALDNNFATWRAYSNSFWPASYLIDQDGRIRYRHFGEGNYTETENAIRTLLDLAPLDNAGPKHTLHVNQTPEIYLGSDRAANYSPEIKLQLDQRAIYNLEGKVVEDEVGLIGPWKIERQAIVAAGPQAAIVLNFLAGKVHLVLSGKSTKPITLLLDGDPLPAKYITTDQNSKGEIFLDVDRKYDIIDLKGDISRHTIQINIPEGISAYAFTFGI